MFIYTYICIHVYIQMYIYLYMCMRIFVGLVTPLQTVKLALQYTATYCNTLQHAAQEDMAHMLDSASETLACKL